MDTSYVYNCYVYLDTYCIYYVTYNVTYVTVTINGYVVDNVIVTHRKVSTEKFHINIKKKHCYTVCIYISGPPDCTYCNYKYCTVSDRNIKHIIITVCKYTIYWIFPRYHERDKLSSEDLLILQLNLTVLLTQSSIVLARSFLVVKQWEESSVQQGSSSSSMDFD